METLLTANERSLLESIVKAGPDKLKRPAQIILMTDEGNSIRQIAAELQVSRSGVFYWIRRFRDQRMAVFGHQQGTRREASQPNLGSEPQPETTAEPKSSVTNDAENQDEGLGAVSEKKLLKSPGLLPDDTMPEAGRKTLLYHFLQMVKHEPGTISGEDIEALHDMRVATRRMRAAFNVLGFVYKAKIIKPFIKGLRQTGRALGRVRDLDVLVEKAQQYTDDLPASERHGLDPLFEVWQSQREQERIAMIQHLESETYKTFKSQFETFLRTPDAGSDDFQKLNIGKIGRDTQSAIPNLVRYAVPLLVYTRLAVVNAYETLLPTATILQLHELRIEFKQLRYTVEFFVEVLGPEAKGVIQEIKQVQDHLGDLNDAEVASLLLGDILNTWEDQHRQISIDERPDPLPLLNYLTYRVKERHDLIREFPDVWRRFTQPMFRKNLALAIAAL